ncbi:MAG: hypothetical protein HWD59_07880 [Coxiellaceae bacterium]|nr:MAG: hypothetical protein HWD59_07880 [Coxiellaceae bacterium]
MQCHQCENRGFYRYEQTQIYLCLSCYSKLQEAETNKLNTLLQLNQHVQQMTNALVGYDLFPKVEKIVRKGDTAVNQTNVTNTFGLINTGSIHADNETNAEKDKIQFIII